MGELLTLWTIRVSLALYAWVLIALLTSPLKDASGAKPYLRFVWAASVGIFLVHVGMAFHHYHDWSHARAFAHTASETERLMGVRFGYGIYFNHLFAIIWLCDAVDWLRRPNRYATSVARLHLAVHAYLFFIAFNGAVIFEDGPVRWAGVALTPVIGWLSVRRWLSSRSSGSAQASMEPS